MTSVGSGIESDGRTEDVATRPAVIAAVWQWFRDRWQGLGERVNPILVKEARQALKSKQFTITFALLLVCVWLWSVIGVAIIGPEIYYTTNGPGLFFGYYLMLAFPLFVVVPYGAFRSLTGEREDGTYELLSITSLRPWQIVSGKLGSAMLQMIVYVSAVSPCLAFTYVLRGIDIVVIGTILFYTVLASMALSLIALLLATAVSQKHWQIFLTVVVIFGLGFALWGACALCYEILRYPNEIGNVGPEFWITNACIVSAFGAYYAIIFLAAAAQLTFESDNRSTPLRVAMMVPPLLLIAWLVGISVYFGWEKESAVICLIPATIHWYIFGTMMTGESPTVSSRVKRRLPQSFLGRVFLTWFSPGPATGYVFALANTTALGLLVIGYYYTSWLVSGNSRLFFGSTIAEAIMFSLGLIAYMAIFLGIGNVCVAVLRKVSKGGIFLGLLIQALLLLLSCGGPLVIHLMSPTLRRSGYSPIHMFNPFWTLVEIIDRPSSIDELFLLGIVGAVAAVVLALNLPAIARVVLHVRVAEPQRVIEEDEVARRAAEPEKPVRKSPWD